MFAPDSDDEDTIVVSDTPPEGVNPEFARCLYALKWRIYETTVLGPELNTPEAQQNGLIQTYVRQLGALHKVLEKALSQTITDADMRSFRVSLRPDILKCAQRLRPLIKQATNVADHVVYRDFLNERLRMYPFVHHNSAVEDVEEW